MCAVPRRVGELPVTILAAPPRNNAKRSSIRVVQKIVSGKWVDKMVFGGFSVHNGASGDAHGAGELKKFFINGSCTGLSGVWKECGQP
jgi:hypothetical protein